jgi:hypothetical protein
VSLFQIVHLADISIDPELAAESRGIHGANLSKNFPFGPGPIVLPETPGNAGDPATDRMTRFETFIQI